MKNGYWKMGREDEKIDIDKNVRKYDNIRNKLHKSDGKAIL